VSTPGAVEIGIDIGGTFIDVVCRCEDAPTRIVKIPTTRANPAEAVLHAIALMKDGWGIEPSRVARVVHGTTVATNAVLERKGARLGLITTAGFKDVLEIGRQMRQAMYRIVLEPEAPVFLAPGARRKEVVERIGASGEVLIPLDEASVRRAADELVADGADALAVCLLFSFLNPAHERRVREIIRAAHPGVFVSLSCEVDPTFREYERTVATAFDAYIKPGIARYLDHLERGLLEAGISAPLQIMQSRGGVSIASIARQRPVRLFLSGPAAGVVGGRMVGHAAALDDVITVDVGGTSCDIALVRKGKPLIRPEGRVAGYPIRVPMVDVNAIGAGGGSIAWLDGAGSLRVGPQSAGSEPGPACYDRGGDEATVTDASVVLGYIDPGYFAGGSLALDPGLARAALKRQIAGPLGVGVEAAALGIHRVVNAQMAEGIRLVSIRQGFDPREFALVALGGAGPLHATTLARELGIRTILVPRHPGVLSAAGLLVAPIEHEVASAFPHTLDGLSGEDVRGALAEIDLACAGLMAKEGIAPEAARVLHFADVCFVGQSYHLEIPFHGDDPDPIRRLYRDFIAHHDRVYGHSTEGPARIVNLRAIHQAGGLETPVGEAYAVSGEEPRKGTRDILLADPHGRVAAGIYDRAAMSEGMRIDGPAVIEQADTTTLLEPRWHARVVAGGTLLIERT
jgi:N-methylhydantoinase A